MKQFHARNFKAARELFEQAAQGPERDVAQRAKLHISHVRPPSAAGRA